VTLDALDGADVGVQVHLLAEGDDGRRVAGDLVRGRRDGAEHGGRALGLERVDRLLGERRARLLEVLEAGIEGDEGGLGDARDGLEDALRRL